jgi:hypothetical protein
MSILSCLAHVNHISVASSEMLNRVPNDLAHFHVTERIPEGRPCDPHHIPELHSPVKVPLSQICAFRNNVVAATSGVPYGVLAREEIQI